MTQPGAARISHLLNVAFGDDDPALTVHAIAHPFGAERLCTVAVAHAEPRDDGFFLLCFLKVTRVEAQPNVQHFFQRTGERVARVAEALVQVFADGVFANAGRTRECYELHVRPFLFLLLTRCFFLCRGCGCCGLSSFTSDRAQHDYGLAAPWTEHRQACLEVVTGHVARLSPVRVAQLDLAHTRRAVLSRATLVACLSFHQFSLCVKVWI
jgi:hypothetical protein